MAFQKGYTPWNKNKKCSGYNWGRKKGFIPWNKGKHPEYVQGENNPFYGKHHTAKTKEKIRNVHKGCHCSLITEFKKGQIPWNKGKNSKVKRICRECSKEFWVHPCVVKNNQGKFCSIKCLSKSLSKIRKGKDNPFYRHHHTEKARKRIGLGATGEKNANYGKPAHYSKKEYYNKICMRSPWEVNIAKWLDKIGWKWQYEPKRFYLKDRTYCPDFYLPDKDIWWEVKGWFNKEHQETIKQFRELYPEENLLVLTKLIYEATISQQGNSNEMD